jgi:predicted aldo/keto reductase-like oxidoreductase
MDKISRNIRALKQEGLIRFAVADTYSGESTYLKQIEAGCFDAIFINFNFGDHLGEEKVLPRAVEKGLGVFARETFMKSMLFRMAEEVQFEDSNGLAQAALRWTLAHDAVTVVAYGTSKPAELLGAVQVLRSLTYTAEDQAVLDRIRQSKMFREFSAQKTKEFKQ